MGASVGYNLIPERWAVLQQVLDAGLREGWIGLPDLKEHQTDVRREAGRAAPGHFVFEVGDLGGSEPRLPAIG